MALPALALLLAAAAPAQRGFNLQMFDSPQTLPVPPRPPPKPPNDRFSPAPTPNRDVDAPLQFDGSKATTVSPSIITRGESYRGDGFNKGSSAQSEQEKRVRPGAGFNLRMPLSPN